jgi:hypothetical protein
MSVLGRIGIVGLAPHHYVYHSLPRALAQRGHPVLVSGPYCPPSRYRSVQHLPESLSRQHRLDAMLVFPSRRPAPLLPRVSIRVVAPHEDTPQELIEWCARVSRPEAPLNPWKSTGYASYEPLPLWYHWMLSKM